MNNQLQNTFKPYHIGNGWGEFVDIEILKDARVTVKQDLELIIEDSNRRFFSHHIKENQHMMSMILDFILSL